MMKKVFWIICPKCGGINDSDFLDIDFKESQYESPKQFKEINTGAIINCSDCGINTVLDMWEVVTDENL